MITLRTERKRPMEDKRKRTIQKAKKTKTSDTLPKGEGDDGTKSQDTNRDQQHLITTTKTDIKQDSVLKIINLRIK